MNKHMYRIVFNEHRGQLMAVAEHASSCGKVASGSGDASGCVRRLLQPVLSGVAFAALLTLGSVWLSGGSQAQVIANPSAPRSQQPTILQTANGLPQVNIQAPSAAGVSRNAYSQFDVQSQGVILNNSRVNVQTQQGGWVQANPWLAAGSAKVILNEVNSANPSLLNGYVEVAGQRAEVVIANPAGISVNGGGFINASQAVLTTGTPVINASGGIDSYRVSGGTVSVSGNGLDLSTTDYAAILARAVQVNAGIWANELKVVTGANQIDASTVAPNTTPVTTAIAGTGSTPAFALDAAQIGGMYAGKIFLIGTEAGLGVNNAGVIAANSGDLVLSHNGWLSNTGTLQASGNVQVNTQGSVSNAGTVYANGNNSVTAAGSVSNSAVGQISAAGNTTITAADELTNRGVINGHTTWIAAVNLNNLATGRIYGDHLAIQTGTLTNTDETVNGVTTLGTLAARTRLDIGAGNIVNSEHALIYSGGDMAVGGSLDGNQQAVGSAQSLRNGSATIDVAGNLAIAAGTLTNANDHFAYSIQELTDLLQTNVYQDNGDPAHYYRIVDRHIYEPVVTQNDPGQITAGGNTTLTGDTVTNQQSKIIAGGNLVATAGAINNTQVTDQRRINDVGNQWTWGVTGGHSDCWPCHWVLDWGMVQSAYNVNTYQTLTVSAGQTLNNSAPGSAAAQALTTTHVRTTVTNMLASGGSAANYGLPSLFHPIQNASANYLIETDPLFTNRNTWLSSDYMTQAIALDPKVTQKRLGDGFYEQQLIREQVADLTGKRFLGDYTSDQQEYQALMDNGITYAKQYNLRPDIALTAAQVAQLTSDIVWLEQETVTLPDGTITQALVPHVYLKPNSGDLTAGGALLSGANVQLNSTGDTFNSGTVAGRQIVELKAANVSNLGQIQGAQVNVQATQDIGVSQGGSVTASDSLNLNAGRNINVTTGTTNSSGTSDTHSASTLDRVAGLYVTGSNGTLVASAGRDLNLMAATVNSAGTVQLNAGNNVNLNAVTTTSSDNFDYGDVGHTRQSANMQTGSTVSARGNLSISAGSDLQGTVATISGGGNVQLTAGQDVNLLAGQSTQSSDVAWLQTSGGLVRTTTATQMTQSSAQALTSSVSGNNVSVTAGRDLVSQGTQFKANDSLSVEGKDSQTFYAVQNTEQKTYSQQSSNGLLGITLNKSSVNDTQAKGTSIGSSLVSTNKIDVNVGNSAVFEGSTLTAKEINFNQTDASKAGQVVLTASIDTSQKSHTETNETAGVWQKQAGSGEAKQTASQTQLNGQVNMNANLQVTAQLGLQPGQTIEQQVSILSQQPGLRYLRDLQNNPKVNLQAISLASQQWDYSQQGLTSAGAALLSVAIAAYTGNMGAQMLGGTTATQTSAATLMESATLGAAVNVGFASLAAQAGVALANNGGDIGKTLKQLGSSDSIKGTLSAMVTAGALTELGNSTSLTGQRGTDNLNSSTSSVATTQAVNQFPSNVLKNVTNNLAGAVINSAIMDKSLDETALSTALSGAFITAGMAQVANSIGDATKPGGALNSYTQALAHALAGCVGGTAAVGNVGGCAPGAVGAEVGELTAKYATDSGMSSADALKLAKTMSAVAGLITTGGDGSDATAVNVAATMGANAAANNYLSHNKLKDEEGELLRLKQKKQSGQCDTTCDTRIGELEALDRLRDEQIAPLIDACEKAGRNNCKGEAIAKQFADANGLGAESMKRESNPGTSGSPFSFNGCIAGDKGGCSYGPLQIAANTGLMATFITVLSKNPVPEAQSFYQELQAAGGVSAAQNGDPAFIQAWMKLTAKDPQFVQYQIDTLINQNLYPVVQELEKVGMDFNSLSQAQKEAIFSAAVQHGSGTDPKAKTRGADNVLERAISVAQSDAQAPSFPTYTRQDLVYGQVEDQMSEAEKTKSNLIAQQLQLERQKSKLLELGLGTDAAQIERIKNQVNVLDDKINSITQKVNEQEQYIQQAGQYLKEQAKEALGNPEQFIKDFYKARTEMYPSEARRYQLEMESLLKQYREEQKSKSAK